MTYESSPGASHGRPQEQEDRGGPARGLARCAGRVNGGSRLEEAGLGPSSRRVELSTRLASVSQILEFLNEPELKIASFGTPQPQPPRGRVLASANRGVL